MIVLYFVLACIYCLGIGGMFMFCWFTDVEQGRNKCIYATVAILWPLMALGWAIVGLVAGVKAQKGYWLFAFCDYSPNKTPPLKEEGYPVIMGCRRQSGAEWLKKIKDG